jgi:hypothetical protein
MPNTEQEWQELCSKLSEAQRLLREASSRLGEKLSNRASFLECYPEWVAAYKYEDNIKQEMEEFFSTDKNPER